MSRRATFWLAAAAVLVGAAIVAGAYLLTRSSSTPRSGVAAPAVTLSPGASFQQAYAQVATTGGTIAVKGGAYPAEEPDEGAIDLTAVANAQQVNFVCGNGQPVTFAYPAEQFVITGDAHVTFTGSCFHFNRLWIGSGSAGVGASDVLIDGVSMWIFDVSGAQNTTIQNSTVGPDIACGLPSAGAAACQNNAATNEQWWYQAQKAGCGCDNGNFNEPKVHDNQAGQPTSNVLLLNDTIRGISSRDPVEWHAGCLWTGYANGAGLTVQNVRFQDCMAYDVLLNNISPSIRFIGDTFTQPRDAIRGLSDFSQVPLEPYPDIESKCFNGEAVTGLVVTGDTFVNGYYFNDGSCSGMTFPGAVIQGNTIPPGATQVPPQSQGPPVTTTTAPTTTATTSTTTSTTVPTTTTTPFVPDVPTALRENLAVLTWMHSTKKTGGLGYSVAQTQTTHAYKELVALGGKWPA